MRKSAEGLGDRGSDGTTTERAISELIFLDILVKYISQTNTSLIRIDIPRGRPLAQKKHIIEEHKASLDMPALMYEKPSEGELLAYYSLRDRPELLSNGLAQ